MNYPAMKAHQKKIFDYMKTHDRLLLYHTLGTGKTLTSLVCGKYFLNQNSKYKLIIITPKSLLGNYYKENKKFNLFSESELKRIYFFTYHKFYRNQEENLKLCDENTFLIIDEAHNLRTDTELGKLSKSMLRCSQRSKKLLLLTGTPIVNSINDIFPLMAMIDKNETPSKKQCREIIKNDTEFTKFFKGKISFFEPDEKFMKEFFPVVKEHNYFFPMSPGYLSEYKKIESNILDQGIKEEFGEKNLLSFYNGIRRAVNGIGENFVSEKIRWVTKNFIMNYRGRKCLIYSSFLNHGSNLIKSALEYYNKTYRIISGEISEIDRNEAVTLYNTNQIQYLIITKAGGEGLDLKGTDDIIILERTWNQASINQIIGRGARLGSHTNKAEKIVNVYNLFLIKDEEGDLKFFRKIKSLKTVEELEKYLLEQKKMKRVHLPSADIYLYFITRKKEIVNNFYLKKLQKLSV